MNTIDPYYILIQQSYDQDVQFIKDYLNLHQDINARLAVSVLCTYFSDYSVDLTDQKCEINTSYKYEDLKNIENLINSQQLSNILNKSNNYIIYEQADNDYERLAIILKSIVDIN